MPTPTKGPRLGGSPTHERMILASLASQLFEHGRITTTETKAKRVRPLAEKLITKAKRGDLHARRMVLSTIHDKSVVHKLFTEIAPTMAEREGGYVRIIKTGNRKGDNAPMAVIELVTESLEEGRAAKGKQAKRSGSASRPARPAADAQSTENVAPSPEEAAATPVSDEPLDATPAATEQAAEAEKMPETTEVDANTTETTGPVATEADDPAK